MKRESAVTSNTVLDRVHYIAEGKEVDELCSFTSYRFGRGSPGVRCASAKMLGQRTAQLHLPIKFVMLKDAIAATHALPRATGRTISVLKVKWRWPPRGNLSASIVDTLHRFDIEASCQCDRKPKKRGGRDGGARDDGSDDDYHDDDLIE